MKSWEHCQLPASEWNHAAHVAVAAYYSCLYHPADAHLRMRHGVSAFNACSGGKNTENSGYHESLTRFWVYEIWKYVHNTKLRTRLAAVRRAVAEYGEARGLAERRYGYNILHSTEARRRWVAPDQNFSAETSFFDELARVSYAGTPRNDRAREAAVLLREQGNWRWVGIYDVLPGQIVIVASSANSLPAFPRFPRCMGLCGAAAASANAVVSNDVTSDPRYLTTSASTRSEMIIPILSLANGRVTGLIDVESAEKNAFLPNDAEHFWRCAALLQPMFESSESLK